MSKEYLFHYTKAGTFESIINNQELWFNNINKTNDPYENKKFDFYSKTEKKDISGEYKKIDDDEEDAQVWFFRQLNRMKNRIVKTISFCCGDYNVNPLVDNNRPGYFYPRMWAQYADNSKGVCLVFDKHKLLKELKSVLKKNYFVFNREVTYTNIIDNNYSNYIKNLIVSRNNNYFKRRKFNDAKKIRENLCENIYDYYFTKDIDWSGEKEYRIILINQEKNSNTKEERCKFNLLDCLECCILGENYGLSIIDDDDFEINDKAIQRIRCMCQEKEINLKILKRDLFRSSYFLEDLYSKPEPAPEPAFPLFTGLLADD